MEISEKLKKLPFHAYLSSFRSQGQKGLDMLFSFEPGNCSSF